MQRGEPVAPRVPQSRPLGPPRSPQLCKPCDPWTVAQCGFLCPVPADREGPPGPAVRSCSPRTVCCRGDLLSAVPVQSGAWGVGRGRGLANRGWPRELGHQQTRSPQGKAVPYLGLKRSSVKLGNLRVNQKMGRWVGVAGKGV